MNCLNNLKALCLFKFLLAICGLAMMPSLHAANPYRIMAVGDSISVGYTDLPNWNEPFEFGFRSGLYSRLTNSGVAFQFVGSSQEPWNGGSAGTYAIPTNTPTLDLRPLGQDHCEGYAGKQTSFILGNISTWLSANPPDIILLMIGINDIHDDVAEPTATEQNLSNIVYTVTSQTPNARLIVAQITPYWTNCPGIVKYNTYIREVLVPYFAGQGKHVTTVDQFTNMLVTGTTNIDPAAFSNGINHPKNVIYDRMAQTWFAGIQAVLPFTPLQDPALKWSGLNSTNWNTSETNWAFRTGGNPTTYIDGNPGDDVLFDDTLIANPSITLDTTVSPSAVTFSSKTTAYTISGSGEIAGATGLTKSGGVNGTNSLRLNTTNTFTGDVTLTAGRLVINNSGALGSGSKTITVKSSAGYFAELHLNGSNAPVVLPADFSFDIYGDSSFQGNIVNDAGNNIVNGSINIVVGGGHGFITVLGGSLTLNGTVNNARTSNRIIYFGGTGTNTVAGVIQDNPNNPAGRMYVYTTGGTWILSNPANTYTGATFVQTNSTLVVNGRIAASTGGGVIVQNGGTLSGTGIILAATTNQSGSVLSPGPSVGTLTVNNNLTLQGTAVMEISRAGGVLANDRVAGVSTLNYGGTLIVTNAGGSPLQAGDSFKLFAATNYVASFASVIYPSGYTFTNTLATDGTISVLTAPVITSPTLSFVPSGSDWVFTWSGSGFKLQMQTNSLATGLNSNWVDVPGGDTSGVSVPAPMPGILATFFRLISTR